MESKKVFTKAMLQEECGVIDVTDDSFVRDVYKVKAKKQIRTVTKPTLMIQKSQQADGKFKVHYIGLTVSLYNYKTKKYVNMPFSKLRWIWEHGECPMGVCIDHIDTNPLNNKLWNLRLLSEKENHENKKVWKQFEFEEICGKSVEELCLMISNKMTEEFQKIYFEQAEKIYKKTSNLEK